MLPTTIWYVTEIRLEARYCGHDPDTITVPARSILKFPAPVHSVQTGADGTAQPSVGAASLRVEGIDLKNLETITWAPSHLSFQDSITGEKKEFPVRLIDTQAPDTAKFLIDT